jgi:hypothetical protein
MEKAACRAPADPRQAPRPEAVQRAIARWILAQVATHRPNQMMQNASLSCAVEAEKRSGTAEDGQFR